MVKKVIDIIPPDDKPKDQLFESTPGLPRPNQPQPEVKPKITFLNRNADTGQNSESPNLGKGNFFKGIFFKLLVAVVMVVLAMYAADSKFAQALIKIWPATSDLHQEFKINVDPSISAIDKDKNIIPGFEISVEDTIKNEFPVTGQKNIQGKAQGMVKIFNNYTAQQRLVKNTRLQAPLEKLQPALAKDETPWFRTTEDIILAPKSSATVKVVADAVGEKYNIEPSVFSIPGLAGTPQYTFIYGQSFEKFQGGSQNSAPEVKKEDIENAKTALADFAKNEIKKALEAKVKQQGLEIVSDSIEKFEFGSPEILAKAGDSVSKIGGKITAKATVLAYKKSDIDNLSKILIVNKISAGDLPNEESFNARSSYSGIDPASSRPSLMVAAGITIYSKMDEIELKKGLSEKGRQEAQLFLMNYPGIKEVKIQLSPPWRLNVPRPLDRIQIQILLD